jgi:hypothetical protein
VAVIVLLGLVVLGDLDAPRLDAELAEPQMVVGAELDRRPGDHRQPVAARLLEQVRAQLVGNRLLDPDVALAVLRRQPDDVVVGDIGARAHRLVRFHLPPQTMREFIGRTSGEKRAKALDQAGDLGLRLRKTLISSSDAGSAPREDHATHPSGSPRRPATLRTATRSAPHRGRSRDRRDRALRG